MKNRRRTMNYLSIAVVVSLTAGFASPAAAKPLKVFILAGQSNMEGPARIETFDYIGDDPATAPLLKQMRGADGKPRICDHVWISYLTGDGEKNFEITGKLTAGYGSMWGLDPNKPGTKSGRSSPSASRWTRRSTSRCSSSRRLGVARVCTRIFARRARGHTS